MNEFEVFRRHAVDVIEARELEARLAKARASKKPLRIKFGMDPSSPDLHVGHSVQLLRLRAVQTVGGDCNRSERIGFGARGCHGFDS